MASEPKLAKTETQTSEIFSYHLIRAPARWVLARLAYSGALARVDGLLHSECLLTMNLGQAVLSPARYNFRCLAFFGRWRTQEHLQRFLQHPPYPVFDPDKTQSWHVRMRFFRRWGNYSPLDGAYEHLDERNPSGSVVAVTLARLRLTQTFRFAKWGKPVEAQVRDDPNKTLATVAFRPLGTFSTFSVWRTEDAMRQMVKGHGTSSTSLQHRNAMLERAKRPFHHEFTTLRFAPISEHGAWDGQTNFCRLTPQPPALANTSLS